jgi:hypothetical protein
LGVAGEESWSLGQVDELQGGDALVEVWKGETAQDGEGGFFVDSVDGYERG